MYEIGNCFLILYVNFNVLMMVLCGELCLER